MKNLWIMHLFVIGLTIASDSLDICCSAGDTVKSTGGNCTLSAAIYSICETPGSNCGTARTTNLNANAAAIARIANDASLSEREKLEQSVAVILADNETRKKLMNATTIDGWDTVAKLIACVSSNAIDPCTTTSTSTSSTTTTTTIITDMCCSAGDTVKSTGGNCTLSAAIYSICETPGSNCGTARTTNLNANAAAIARIANDASLSECEKLEQSVAVILADNETRKKIMNATTIDGWDTVAKLIECVSSNAIDPCTTTSTSTSSSTTTTTVITDMCCSAGDTVKSTGDNCTLSAAIYSICESVGNCGAARAKNLNANAAAIAQIANDASLSEREKLEQSVAVILADNDTRQKLMNATTIDGWDTVAKLIDCVSSNAIDLCTTTSTTTTSTTTTTSFINDNDNSPDVCGSAGETVKSTGGNCTLSAAIYSICETPGSNCGAARAKNLNANAAAIAQIANDASLSEREKLEQSVAVILADNETRRKLMNKTTIDGWDTVAKLIDCVSSNDLGTTTSTTTTTTTTSTTTTTTTTLADICSSAGDTVKSTGGNCTLSAAIYSICETPGSNCQNSLKNNLNAHAAAIAKFANDASLSETEKLQKSVARILADSGANRKKIMNATTIDGWDTIAKLIECVSSITIDLSTTVTTTTTTTTTTTSKCLSIGELIVINSTIGYGNESLLNYALLNVCNNPDLNCGLSRRSDLLTESNRLYVQAISKTDMTVAEKLKTCKEILQENLVPEERAIFYNNIPIGDWGTVAEFIACIP